MVYTWWNCKCKLKSKIVWENIVIMEKLTHCIVNIYLKMTSSKER